jgi:hypothetical protein
MQAAQQPSSRVSKQSILKFVVVLYIVLSAAYILFTQFQTYQANLIQQAYYEGRVATIEELISNAEKSCQPFPVFTEEKQVELINLACLMDAGEGETTDSVPPEAGSE